VPADKAGLAVLVVPFRFVAVETVAPYSVGVYTVDETTLAVGDELCDMALRAWRKATTDNAGVAQVNYGEHTLGLSSFSMHAVA